MASYFCLITVLGDGSGVQPPQPPLGIWGPTDPRPTPPIAGPGRPPWWGIANDPGWSGGSPRPPVAGWPGGLPGGGGFPGQGGPVDPGYSPPWAQPRPPYIDNTLPGMQPHPEHPIYFPPPGGQPPLGIWGPTDPRPTNPIANPGNPNFPGGPPQIWGPTDPRPTHPIVLPPGLPPTIPGEGDGPERKVEWKTAWTPTTGWIVVGIPAEGTLVPTPS